MRKKTEPLATFWEIDGALWEPIRPVLLRYWPPKKTGRPPADVAQGDQRHHLPHARRLPTESSAQICTQGMALSW